MKNSKIEWCHHTWNPWIGCTKVSPACDHCYAERSMPAKFQAVTWGAGQPRKRTSQANWREPVKWNAQAQREGKRYRVFCASLADVFDNEVPQDWRADLFKLIAATPHLDWLLLTKRIGNVEHMVMESMRQMFHSTKEEPPTWPWPNVWLGATVVNQAEADRDIPKLLAMPATKRFASMEPLLGYVDLTELQPPGEARTWIDALRGLDMGMAGIGPSRSIQRLDWVIVGGESGPQARPMHPDWASSLRDQCTAAGVAYHFKQWGEWLPISQQTEEFTNGLYCSSRLATPHEDQGAIDELYGRTLTVPTCVIQADGTAVDILVPMAFQAGKGSMQTFRVGKKAAGRLLDGRTWDKAP